MDGYSLRKSLVELCEGNGLVVNKKLVMEEWHKEERVVNVVYRDSN